MTQRTLLITGASGGIGSATAERAAALGWAVALHYGKGREAAETLAEAINAAGGRAAAFGADMSDERQIVALFLAIDAALPPLGGLVNNAARAAPRKVSVADLDAAEINSLLAVNVTGAMIAGREAAARLSTARGGAGGAIVNVSSRAVHHTAPNLWVHYAASKAALDIFTRGFALEVANQGIRVNGVRPGLIDTPIHARAGMADRVARAEKHLPMGRAGRPEEVAEAILWLASDAASYVNGSILDVGGGA